MRNILIPLGTISILAGCALPPGTPRVDSCADLSGPAEEICRYINAPLALSDEPIQAKDRAFPFRKTERDIGFVDPRGRSWQAPAGTLTDGASIPPVFVPVVGEPTSEEFAVAAALHDAYCGWGNEKLPTWQARDWRTVHRMFYEALIVGGTPEIKAKSMYAAVMMGGPRWSMLFDREGEGEYLPQGHARPEWAEIPATEMQDALRDVINEIEQTDATLDDIDKIVAEFGTVEEQLARITPPNPGGWDSEGNYRPPEEKGYVIDNGIVIEWEGLPPPFDPKTGETYDGDNLPPEPTEDPASPQDGNDPAVQTDPDPTPPIE